MSMPRRSLTRWLLSLAFVSALAVPLQAAEESAAPGAIRVFHDEQDAAEKSTQPPAKHVARPLRRDPGSAKTTGPDTRAPLTSAMPDLATVAASLSLVLALFFVVAWMMKKSLPKSASALPRDVVQVLGRTQLAGKQFAHLVRCGNKLLLVNVTAGGAETLTEITDPLEVDRLVGICAQQGSNSSTAAFREVFEELSRERKRG